MRANKLLSKRRKMSFISGAPEHLTYFDRQLEHPDWENAKVLDFGGNWCIDCHVLENAFHQPRIAS